MTKTKNEGFTLKEMMISIANKVDRIDEKLNAGAGKIAEQRESIKAIKWVIGGICAILVFMGGAILNLIVS